MRWHWVAIGIAGIGWLAWRNSEEKRIDLTAGTTGDAIGFLERSSGRFIEMFPNGMLKRDETLSPGKDARVVGTNRGTSLLWQEGRKIALAPLDHLDDTQEFGKRVDRICAQTATTPSLFGAAWVERDNSIWVLRGAHYDTHPARAELVATDTQAEDPYCALTSSEDGLVLLYRYGNRTEVLRCDDTKCGRPRKLALPRSDTILGIGCAAKFCVVATRSRKGVTTLQWTNDKDQITQTRVLNACKDGAVKLAGNDEKVAIAYSNGPDPVVEYTDGRDLWSLFAGPGDANATPVVAWHGSVLQIAFPDSGSVEYRVFRP